MNRMQHLSEPVMNEPARPQWKENSIADMKVARLAPFGAFLDAGTGNSADDILLHKEQQTGEVHVGDTVRVFLYHDPHHRMTASMRLPQIPLGGLGYAEVLLTTRFGAFVEAGTERGIFLPHTETLGTVRAGQKIWVRLYVDKTGRLAVTMHVDEDMRRLARPARGIKVGGKVTGTVYNITDDGAFLITREKWIAFLYRKDMPRALSMGEEVTGRVTYIRDDGHLNISLRPQKEKALADDGALLLAYLERHGGVMPFSDASDPGAIQAAFDLSKAAFKRAAGHLLKEGKIERDERGRYRLFHR